VCEVKGRAQEGFDGEPTKSGVALGAPSLVLNIIIASHSVDNPMANLIIRRENRRVESTNDDSPWHCSALLNEARN
jgi:hypothetical protein